MLEAGMKAPQFTLTDGKGNTVSLADYLGKKVVLYFYPKDNTPGLRGRRVPLPVRMRLFAGRAWK